LGEIAVCYTFSLVACQARDCEQCLSCTGTLRVILSRGGRGSALLNPAAEAKNLATLWISQGRSAKERLRFFVADAPQND